MAVHVDPSYCIQVLIINDKLPPNGQNDPWSCNAWAITNSLSIQLCTPGNQTWQWEILQKKGFNGKISYKLVNFPLPCLKKIEYQRVTTETWSRRSIMMYSVMFSKLEISKFANDSPRKTASCSLQHLALCCWRVVYHPAQLQKWSTSNPLPKPSAHNIPFIFLAIGAEYNLGRSEIFHSECIRRIFQAPLKRLKTPLPTKNGDHF